MPPTLALFLTIGFVVFLFRRDIRERPNVTGALWLPLLWMLIICSRAISEWLNIFGFDLGGTSLEEGSPIDAYSYFALIAAGIYVLNTRQVSLSEIFRNNGWLMAFLLYCLIAVIWSDFPLVSLKRWIKILGHPIMALLVLTEPDPAEALTTLMKRCAYVVVPVSILFIKYFPQLGRNFSAWGGGGSGGITDGKNALGYDCLILGFFFFWYFLQVRQHERNRHRRNELLLIGGFFVMIWWLFRMAQSSTSLVSLLLGAMIMVLVGRRFVNKRWITSYILIGLLAIAAAEMAFGVSAHVLNLLSKDSTLSDRTLLWADVLKVKINPLLGVGFESFWLGDRLKQLHENRAFQPNEAHNGYLETYLNLGLIGLFILIGLLVATYRKARLKLLKSFEWGRYRLGFLVAVVLYNFTEASFKTVHPVWFAFYIIALDYPRVEYAPAAEMAESEEEAEATYVLG